MSGIGLGQGRNPRLFFFLLSFSSQEPSEITFDLDGSSTYISQDVFPLQMVPSLA